MGLPTGRGFRLEAYSLAATVGSVPPDWTRGLKVSCRGYGRCRKLPSEGSNVLWRNHEFQVDP